LQMYRDDVAMRQQEAPAPSEANGSLEITSKPAGCSIWLNGDLKPVVTPAKLDELPLDRELHIKLTKEGFEAYRTSAKLTKEAPFNEIVVELKKITATVVLWVEPPASVLIDGKLWRGNRSRIEGLTGGEDHRFVLVAPGYTSKTLVVNVQPGETRTFNIQLMKSAPQAAPEDRAHNARPR
jgi:eukaryotic-like serine/threonine-protein kinase